MKTCMSSMLYVSGIEMTIDFVDLVHVQRLVLYLRNCDD